LTLLQGRRAMLNTKVSATKYNDNGQDIATTTIGPKSTNYASLFKNKIFMLCGSCFWSASCLFEMGYDQFNRCPQCNEIIDHLPICSNEAFLLNCDCNTGISLEFFTFNK
jgi:hypothetical protein